MSGAEAELDERLTRYARELDVTMTTFEIPGSERGATPSASTRHSTPAVTTSRVVWLAAAAALVLIVAGSAVWWQGRSTDELGVNGTTGDTVTVDTDPAPDGDSGTVPVAQPLTWEASDLKQYLSVPTAVTAYRGGWLAVGTDDVLAPVWWSSSDGRSWGTESPLPQVINPSSIAHDEGRPGSPLSIAADESVAVAVGNTRDESVAWMTDDGMNWTVYVVAPASYVGSVTHTADGFVAVGTAHEEPSVVGGPPTSVPAAWQSDDGIQWTRLVIPVVGGGQARVVAAVGDVTVIGGHDLEQPMLLARKDERWWRVNPQGVGDVADGDGSITAVVAAGDGFVATGWYGDQAMMWTSVDGINWPGRPIDAIVGDDPSPSNSADVAAVGDVVVVVPGAVGEGFNASDAWVSVNGGDWTRTLTGVQHVVAGNGRFVALGKELWVSSEVAGE